MRNGKTKHLIRYSTCLFCVFAFAGCSGKYIIVKDEKGFPIQNAEVYATSLSMTIGPNLTNKEGIAFVPSNVQGTHWISISKEGYAGTCFDVPRANKIEVILTQEINTK
jgi:hypothetical protein